jgi:isocitrate/isopropylmalate dehydrogenase
MMFLDEIYNRDARGYPDIRQDFALVDTLSMWFVKNLEHLDVVVVASNLFGDIIADFGFMLQSSMGFAAGATVMLRKSSPRCSSPSTAPLLSTWASESSTPWWPSKHQDLYSIISD